MAVLRKQTRRKENTFVNVSSVARISSWGGKRDIFPTNGRNDVGVANYIYIYSFSICLVIHPTTKLSIALFCPTIRLIRIFTINGK